LADRSAPSSGARLPSVPSLTERLRAKRGDLPAEEAPAVDMAPQPSQPEPAQPEPPTAHAAAEDAPSQAPEPPSEQLSPPPAAPAEADPTPLTATDPTATPDEQLPPRPTAPAEADPAPLTASDPTATPDEQLPPPPAAVTKTTRALDITVGRATLPDGQMIELLSGLEGPAAVEYDQTQWVPSRFNWQTHVEGHAAALMRQHQLTELELTTNHPDGVCRACDVQAPAMMSPGAKLIVYTPGPDGTRTQWINQDGVHNHDPDTGSASDTTDGRIQLRPGGCWGEGTLYFDTWAEAWDVVDSLISHRPFFFDVIHVGGAWQPFSLIGSRAGTAVAEFVRSNTPFQMRLHGLASNPPGPFESVRVQWTSDEPSPVSFEIYSMYLLSRQVARDTAELLIATEDRNKLPFAEVPVFPNQEVSRQPTASSGVERIGRARSSKTAQLVGLPAELATYPLGP